MSDIGLIWHPLALILIRAERLPRSWVRRRLPYINLVMLETQFQVIVDGFVGDLAQ